MTDDHAQPVLLRCPFCGGTKIRFDRHPKASRSETHYGADVWSTCCYDCGATFPNMYSQEALIAKWQRRPQPASDPDVAENARLREAVNEALLLADGYRTGASWAVVEHICEPLRAVLETKP